MTKSDPYKLGEKFEVSEPTKAIKTTQLSLDYIRAEGYSATVVEKWNKFGRQGHGVRQDLFGCIDIIAMGRGGTIAIQCCTTQVAAHVTKVSENKHLPNMLAAGWRVVIHSWQRKQGIIKLKVIDITEPAPLKLTG